MSNVSKQVLGWLLVGSLLFGCVGKHSPEDAKQSKEPLAKNPSMEPTRKPVHYYSKDPQQLIPDSDGNIRALTDNDPVPVKINKDSVQFLTLSESWSDKRFPVEVFALKNLKYLWVGMRGFQTIPNGLSGLEHLEMLDIQHGAIQHLPDDFCQIKQLKSATFLYSDLKELPDCIGELKQLEYLHLGHSKITRIPDSIGKLANLKELFLNGEPDRPHVSAAGYQKVKELLPNCAVFYNISKVD